MMKLASVLVFLAVASSIEAGYVNRVVIRSYRSTYLLVRSPPLNMHQAKHACARFGGFLATINNQREHHFLVAKLQHYNIRSAWVGLNDKANEKVFRWDGSNVAGFKKWCPHEPNNFRYGEDCVELLGPVNYKCLNDLPCTRVLPYICEVARRSY
ncbi:low affinity immunoglobulin epsilon Fc receptor-like [Clytia hemisphaerica]|eukprot:TCONS_00065193-protein